MATEEASQMARARFARSASKIAFNSGPGGQQGGSSACKKKQTLGSSEGVVKSTSSRASWHAASSVRRVVIEAVS